MSSVKDISSITVAMPALQTAKFTAACMIRHYNDTKLIYNSQTHIYDH